MRTRIPFALLATALACSVFAAPAQALRARVFVSAAGVDSGNCSFEAPCRTLTFALSAVEAGGEITMIDSAGYDPITITQSVTITSPAGVEAGIAVPSGVNAITISNTSPATITLRGLTLEGDGTGGHGILLNSTGGGTLNIIDTVVKDFSESGIAIQPAGGNLYFAISNSYSLNNELQGINIAPTGSGKVTFTIDQTTANNNSSNGIELNGTNVLGSLTRIQANYNQSNGVYLTTGSNASIKNCYVTINLNYGISVNNSAIINISGSDVTFDTNFDVFVDGSSTAVSYGDNNITAVNGTLREISLQ